MKWCHVLTYLGNAGPVQVNAYLNECIFTRLKLKLEGCILTIMFPESENIHTCFCFLNILIYGREEEHV
jgi:hypothetical protein